MSLVDERTILRSIVTKQDRLYLLNKVIGARLISYEIKNFFVPKSDYTELSEKKSYYTGTIRFDNETQKEASFFKFAQNEGEIAKHIFKAASKLNQDGILQPWFLTNNKLEKTWILCYERFNYLLSELPDNDIFELPENWRLSVRNSMETIKYIHERYLLHLGLKKRSSYALIKDKNGFKIKILFDRNSSSENSVYNIKKAKLDDWKDYKDVLEFLLKSLPQTDDLKLFLSYFGLGQNGKYKVFVDRLIRHPFLLRAEEKMQLITNVQHAIITQMISQNFRNAVNGEKFSEYENWDKKLDNWLANIYSRQIRAGIRYNVLKGEEAVSAKTESKSETVEKSDN
ncbi:uncharacterized protein LOC112182800 isoform X2 [Rosa chinensis]|uniref:uncharacterized protein LOC112182800 isoform X2 n=1 Tax=Rosa chinensis TaxID=74649 RepID=UPI001AD90E88|nr:uncharacterized protein LOC112182800 isoform X2 [Rosa chinensis]